MHCIRPATSVNARFEEFAGETRFDADEGLQFWQLDYTCAGGSLDPESPPNAPAGMIGPPSTRSHAVQSCRLVAATS
jgi:hypothetical protein